MFETGLSVDSSMNKFTFTELFCSQKNGIVKKKKSTNRASTYIHTQPHKKLDTVYLLSILKSCLIKNCTLLLLHYLRNVLKSEFYANQKIFQTSFIRFPNRDKKWITGFLSLARIEKQPEKNFKMLHLLNGKTCVLSSKTNFTYVLTNESINYASFLSPTYTFISHLPSRKVIRP